MTIRIASLGEYKSWGGLLVVECSVCKTVVDALSPFWIAHSIENGTDIGEDHICWRHREHKDNVNGVETPMREPIAEVNIAEAGGLRIG